MRDTKPYHFLSNRLIWSKHLDQVLFLWGTTLEQKLRTKVHDWPWILALS